MDYVIDFGWITKNSKLRSGLRVQIYWAHFTHTSELLP